MEDLSPNNKIHEIGLQSEVIESEPINDGKSLNVHDNIETPKPKVVPVEKKEELEPIFAKKLKKTATVKSKIDDRKLESVELKHHEFEPCPQENNPEKPGNLTLGIPLQYKDDKKCDTERKESIKKVKKKQIKTKQTKEANEIVADATDETISEKEVDIVAPTDN